MPTRLIAASFALTAFATAVVIGLLADNAAVTVLWRALVAMIVCYFLALIIGDIARRAVEEHIEHYKQAHPIEPEEAKRTASVADPGAGGVSPSSGAPETGPRLSSPSETAHAEAERTPSSDSSAAA